MALAYFNRGNARNELGDKEGAIADYTQAIQLNPDDAGAYYDRGIARNDLGDKEGASADYTQAIQLNPGYADAYNNRGIARKALGDKQAAIADYQQAANLYQQQRKEEDYKDALDQIKKLEKKFFGLF